MQATLHRQTQDPHSADLRRAGIGIHGAVLSRQKKTPISRMRPIDFITDQFRTRHNLRSFGGTDPNPMDLRKAVLRIIKPLEREFEIDKGYRDVMTVEVLQAEIDRIVGPRLAGKFTPIRHGKRSQGSAGLLVLQCSHPTLNFELQQHLGALTEGLAKFGFKTVKGRVG